MDVLFFPLTGHLADFKCHPVAVFNLSSALSKFPMETFLMEVVF